MNGVSVGNRLRLLHRVIWGLLVGFVLVPTNGASAASIQEKGVGERSLARFYRCAGQVGLQVVELPSGRIVLEHRGHEPLIPASVVKILTSFAALKWLGPEHVFRTALWSTARPRAGILPGPVYLKSEGDPFLVHDKLLRLVGKLRESGIQRITGPVYVDNSYFSPQTERVCLDEDCDQAYNPTLSATAFEFNSFFVRVKPAGKARARASVSWSPAGRYVHVENLSTTTAKPAKTSIQIQHRGAGIDGREDVRVAGAISVKDRGGHEQRFSVSRPDMFVASALHAALEDTGVSIDRSPGGAAPTPAGAGRLVVYESSPLSEICCGLNRFSNNFMAEMLLRSLGGYVFGAPGSEVKGLEVVRRALLELGVRPGELTLKTGSGLSRECRVSASVFCRVLAAAHADPAMQIPFAASLAVAGQVGTLRNRMKGSTLTVRGKTGTLRDVAAFSGYVEAPGGQAFGVTVLLNDVSHLQEAKSAIDAFLEEAAQGLKGF